MNRIAALETQKTLRDLAGLSRLCDDVAWLDLETLATATPPVFIVGVWLMDEPDAAKQLIARRSASGLSTVVVPRFKSGDLRGVLNTPTSLRVKAGEFDSFSWGGGETIAVSGQTVFETTLHASQYGSVAGLGVTVLSYRSHEAAGCVVLCTAGLTSRQLGVSVAQQRRLWELILDRAKSPMSGVASKIERAAPSPATSVDELLATGDAVAAAVILSLSVGGGNREPNAVAAAAQRLGFSLSDEEVQHALARLPESTVAEMEQGLRRHGWGAFLRRGRLALAERGEA